MKPWILDLLCQKMKSWYTTVLSGIVGLSCYHQISKEIAYWSSQNTNTNMHMWGCLNGSRFGVADQRRQFMTFQFQTTHLFSRPTTEVNSSHIIQRCQGQRAARSEILRRISAARGSERPSGGRVVSPSHGKEL